MIEIKFPSTKDLTKMVMVAAEKKISDKAQRAAAPHGGVIVSFKHDTDGSLQSVELEGAEKAIEAARAALINK